MPKSKIIIAGYPKSGSTWITRLVAELVNSPVSGFLYYPDNNVDVEGLDRPGKFQCFKSHHQYHELKSEDLSSAKIIYVIRDPRDISLSARNFFKYYAFAPSPTDSKLKSFAKRIINKMSKEINGKQKIRSLTNDAIMNGNEKLHFWCRVSWKDHLVPYLKDERILKVKFEDALANPIITAREIANFLKESIDDDKLIEAVEKQSFKTVKEKFNLQEDTTRSNFLRQGKAGQWKTQMNQKEVDRFTAALSKEFAELNYSLE